MHFDLKKGTCDAQIYNNFMYKNDFYLKIVRKVACFAARVSYFFHVVWKSPLYYRIRWVYFIHDINEFQYKQLFE